MGGRTKTIAALAAVLVVGLVVALIATGAGSEDDGGQAGSGEAASGESPKYGGTLVVANADPGPLNPAITSSGATHPVTGQIFNGLVRLNRDFEPQPDLAQSWEVSPDGLAYTFKLRPGVRWHDGKPFSSADVKYTYEEVLVELHPRTRTLAGRLARIETPDANTVVFRLEERYTPFLKLVTEDNGAILPKHLYEGTDPLENPANAEPVGTGPFKFESSSAGRINLVRNENYFKEGRPYLDRIVFRIIPEPPQAFQAFQAGEVNLLPSPEAPFVEGLKAQDGTVVTEVGREGFGRVIRLIPNLNREPFDDVRVRRAMAYAIDTEFIARTAYAGVLNPATGPITSTFEPFYTDDVEKFRQDPEMANRLLDEAGLERGDDGVRFETSLIFDPGFASTAEILKQQLGEVGIALELEVMEFNAWVKQLYIDGDFELGYSQLTDPPDPEIGTRRVFDCDNRVPPAPFSNGAGYCDERVDALFEQAASEQDVVERVKLYGEIQRIIVREQPHIFLVDGMGPYAYDADFAGFEDAGAQATYYFGDTAYWTKGSESPGG